MCDNQDMHGQKTTLIPATKRRCHREKIRLVDKPGWWRSFIKTNAAKHLTGTSFLNSVPDELESNEWEAFREGNAVFQDLFRFFPGTIN